MKEYVLDANAALRYFGVSSAAGGDKVESLFKQSEAGQARLFMSAINLGEVCYTMLKEVGERTAQVHIQILRDSVIIANIDETTAIRAATLKHAYKIGYADSFAAELAFERKATLVSADPIFEKFGKSLKWIRLPAYVSNSKRKPHHN